jgi:tetratricopeptide (TPR) repeat protein
MKHLLAVLAVLAFAPARTWAQDTNDLQRLFEAGQYQRVVESTAPEAPPAALYVAAQSHQKLGAAEQAADVYRQLAERPEGDPWRLIGLSAQSLLQNDAEGAVRAAEQAANESGDLPEAHYQLGLAQAKRQDWRAAAAAFDRAVDLDPAMAYAHYYGGLMHYRANRPDRMANHFEQFLKLAPDAPERPEVLQIMRTLRR